MSCPFVYRPENTSDWADRVLNAVVDGEMAWACPRESAEGSEYCVFHRPLEEKDAEEVTAAFREAIETVEGDGTDAERVALVGATFPGLDLRGTAVGAEGGRAVDLRRATVEGDLRLDGARVGAEFRLDGAEVGGRAAFDDATFEREAGFGSAAFGGPASFRGTAFREGADFSDATFGSDAVFVRTELDGPASFQSTSFELANFRHAAFGGNATFGGATFGTPPAFPSAAFRAGVAFTGADLRDADLSEAELADANLRRANLTDADLTRARLAGADMEHARLNRATLAGADLRGAGLFGCLLGDVEIDEGTRFGRRCVYDPRYDGEHDPALFEDDDRDGVPSTPEGFARKAEATYRLLERVYEANAFPGRARDAYRARRTVRRYRLYAERRVGGWLASKLADLTTGYWERPGRVVGLSVLVIVLAAVAYPFLGGVIPSGAGRTTAYALDPGTVSSVPLPDALVVLRNSLYFSVAVFGSLGYGGFEPATGTVRAVAAAEGLVGTLLVAVLVVVLVRRSTR